MTNISYSKEFTVSAKPELVYKAITNEIDAWWTESSNSATQIGDKLTVKFEKSTKWVMVVSDTLKNRYHSWNVVHANHDTIGISTKDEWKGTNIKWKIDENKTGSNVTFIHEGLLPILECYEICNAGWEYFLGSLKNFLETGKGSPYKNESDKQ